MPQSPLIVPSISASILFLWKNSILTGFNPSFFIRLSLVLFTKSIGHSFTSFFHSSIFFAKRTSLLFISINLSFSFFTLREKKKRIKENIRKKEQKNDSFIGNSIREELSFVKRLAKEIMQPITIKLEKKNLLSCKSYFFLLKTLSVNTDKCTSFSIFIFFLPVSY